MDDASRAMSSHPTGLYVVDREGVSRMWWVSLPHQYGGPKLHRKGCRYFGEPGATGTGSGSHGRRVNYPVRFLRLSGTIYRVELCKLCTNDRERDVTPRPSHEQMTLEFP